MSFMIYDKSKVRQSAWVRQTVQKLLIAVVRREVNPSPAGRTLDIMEDLAVPVSIELVCRLLGFKKLTLEIQNNIRNKNRRHQNAPQLNL